VTGRIGLIGREVTPTVEIRSALKDILAGGIFIGFGLLFAGISLTYELGSPVEMGPGYFPLLLGGLLVLLGLLIVGKGFVAGTGEEIGLIPWRAAALISVAVLFFGATVRGLGLIPALFVATLLTALAGQGTSRRAAAVIAGGLTVLCVLIFVVALQLRLPLIGSWIPV
jgi:hypothetical protein